MKPTLHLDVLLRRTDEGYEAHCLQFDLVEVAPTAEEVEHAMKNVITAHIEYSLAHDNREHLFRSAPVDVWSAFFSSQPYKRLTLDIRPEQTTFPFPDTIDLQETLLNAGQGYRAEEKSPLLVADLGWTPEQAADTRARLASFAEDWDAPGMEGYDDL
jgi:hypothetical protein